MKMNFVTKARKFESHRPYVHCQKVPLRRCLLAGTMILICTFWKYGWSSTIPDSATNCCNAISHNMHVRRAVNDSPRMGSDRISCLFSRNSCFTLGLKALQYLAIGEQHSCISKMQDEEGSSRDIDHLIKVEGNGECHLAIEIAR